MPTSTRLGLPYPALSAQADVPADLLALVNSLDSRTVIFSSGTLAARPVSTAGSPGTLGRMYLQTDTSPQFLWFDYGTGWVGIGPAVGGLADGSVTTPKLADGAVTTLKLADLNVTTGKLADLGVTLAKLAPNSIDASKIVDGAVGSAEVAGQAITAALIQDGAVSLIKLAANSVDGSKIQDGSVSSAEIADGAISTQKIAGSAVDYTKISPTIKASGGAAPTTEALRALGTSAGTAAAGDDTRFSGSTVARGTTLPVSPTLYQLYSLRVTGAGGADGDWLMMWDGTIWRCLGGTPWMAGRDDLDTITSTSWTSSPADLALAVPFAGIYRVHFGALVGNVAANGRARIGIQVNGVAPRETTTPFHYAELQTDAGVQASISKEVAIAGVGAGQILRFQYRCLAAGQTNVFGNKYMTIIAAQSS